MRRDEKLARSTLCATFLLAYLSTGVRHEYQVLGEKESRITGFDPESPFALFLTSRFSLCVATGICQGDHVWFGKTSGSWEIAKTYAASMIGDRS
jgi:hypothetical protein